MTSNTGCVDAHLTGVVSGFLCGTGGGGDGDGGGGDEGIGGGSGSSAAPETESAPREWSERMVGAQRSQKNAANLAA